MPARLIAMLEQITPKAGRVFDTTNIRKEWQKAYVAADLGTLTAVEGKPYDPIYSGLTLHDLRRVPRVTCAVPAFRRRSL